MQLIQGKRFLVSIFMGIQQLGLIEATLIISESNGFVSGSTHGMQYSIGEPIVKGGGTARSPLTAYTSLAFRGRRQQAPPGVPPNVSVNSTILLDRGLDSFAETVILLL